MSFFREAWNDYCEWADSPDALYVLAAVVGSGLIVLGVIYALGPLP